MSVFKFMLLISITYAMLAAANNKVVYGTDDRKEYYEVSSDFKTLADATAGMISNRQIKENAGSVQILTNGTLRQSDQLCSTEKFGDQPLAPICSGFLVGEDLLVTAGHCFKSIGNLTPEQVCANFSWVFDYHLNSATEVNKSNIQYSSVYKCKQVISAQLDHGANTDFAVIKLERKVEGRTPLKFRTEGTVANNADLVVIGHPSGLPTKIADGGKIISNKDVNTFDAALDTFHGNSGSAVIDVKTGLVEGILVAGKTDYDEVSTSTGQYCSVVNVCDMQGNNCLVRDYADQILAGERVTRISLLLDLIK